MSDQDGSAVDQECPEASVNLPVAQKDSGKSRDIAPKTLFERAREAVSNILSAIRDGLRRAFYWVKNKFSPKPDDADV